MVRIITIRMQTATLERGSYIATMVAAVITAFLLLLAAYQFRAAQQDARETLDLEREAKAVDLYVRYNDLMQDAAARKTARNPRGAEWRGNLVVLLAESIFRLRKADSGWVATVAGMLQTEDSIAVVNDLDCRTYDPAFVALAVSTLKHRVCSS